MIFSLAMKNAMRQPRRSLLLGGAVAFGVLVICLVSGFVSGMESAVQNNVTLVSGGHILISGYTGGATGRMQNRSGDATLADAVRKALPEAISVSPSASAQATVVFGSREQQLKVRGVSWGEDKLYSRSLIFAAGDSVSASADRAIVLGAKSAERFGLALGDSVLVRLSTASGQQNVTEYKVGAVFDDAAAGAMTTAFVPFENLREDLNLPEGNYQTLSVFIKDASRADASAAVLKTALTESGFTISTGFGGRSGSVGATGAFGAASAAEGAGSTAGSNSASGRAARTGQATQTAQTGQAVQAAQTGQANQAVQGSNPQAGFSGGNLSGSGLSGSGLSTGTFPTGAFPGGAFMNLSEGSTIYRISTITELSGQIGSVLGAVRWIGIAVFALMLVLTAAGISNTYRMVLIERSKEIGTLRCIGFRKVHVYRTFLLEALVIAAVGALAGILLSFPIGGLIGMIRFDASGGLGMALSAGRLIFDASAIQLVITFAAVLVMAAFAVSGPARRAAALQPVQALAKTA
ncbi:MAG: FtsX-like permease family protein [Rectinemataceae bacterium]